MLASYVERNAERVVCMVQVNCNSLLLVTIPTQSNRVVVVVLPSFPVWRSLIYTSPSSSSIVILPSRLSARHAFLPNHTTLESSGSNVVS